MTLTVRANKNVRIMDIGRLFQMLHFKNEKDETTSLIIPIMKLRVYYST